MKALFGPVIEMFYRVSSTNQDFFILCIMVKGFYEKYISSKNKKTYIDYDRSGVFPKQEVRNKYNSKYQLNYSNPYYVMKNELIKDTRISQTFFRKKTKGNRLCFNNWFTIS